jgi:hypothetical protein
MNQADAVVLERSSIARPKLGTCATCGLKKVLVTTPPMSRCVDLVQCARQMGENRLAVAHGQTAIRRHG